ncbi:hypothetical protein MTF65_13415 [Streptomyces sp. APSN-46.1]|uniref:hypothetical protein n=1 Tax=Streptomyces sp. APSN-46.1 TaxID=2929049 RepID=UPI001FB48FEB|nr:hypothetical protein [Streptomyces sp. APSN-46.1]MCJ1678328.1 hypothetical protein [Streptomyces sp. APSN-46.1]
MRGKPIALGGIFVMALALVLGATVGTDNGAADLTYGHHVLADSKGPAIIAP